MDLVLWDEEGGKAIGVYSMTGGGKTNMLDVLRERVTAMDDAVLVQLNAAGSGDELSWEPLAAADRRRAPGQDNPDVRGQDHRARLQWARHLIGERAETAARTGDSVFQPTRTDPAVVVMIDEIDETANIEGATKLLEFLASKQRKSAVVPDPGRAAGHRRLDRRLRRARQPVHGGVRHAGPGLREPGTPSAPRTRSPTSPGTRAARRATSGIWTPVRQKKLIQRGGRSTSASSAISRSASSASVTPRRGRSWQGAGEITAAAPAQSRERPGSALRERLAHVRELNEDRPLPAGAPPPGTPPVVPGVPPGIVAAAAPDAGLRAAPRPRP